MEEKERAKQYRHWHFLDLLGVVTWVMNRGIRGSALIDRTPPRLTGKPPMVELDRLLKLAAIGKAPDITVDTEQMDQIVSLFHKVALQDGSISSEETAAMKRFVKGHFPEGSSEMKVEHFLTAFKDHHSSEANLKETCYLLRTRLKPGAAKQIVESLYRLAFLHGLESEERREIEKIGEFLGLFSAEIRLAESAARRAFEKS
ncbi:MAG: TerB family tellurite resistance protein [Calditrichaeota bacterium]|nr:TerB family tellurite resistance protein [Calditrichota bacterium]